MHFGHVRPHQLEMMGYFVSSTDNLQHAKTQPHDLTNSHDSLSACPDIPDHTD